MNKYSFCNEFDHEIIDQYDEMLDQCHNQIDIGNLSFNPSEVLFNCDPVAYRIGLIEYVDMMERGEDE